MKSNVPATVKNKDLVEKRREQIIYTSINLFSKKGFYKTTLKDLAREAGISHGNIYDYVGSKEDILFLIHEFLHNKVMEALKRSISGTKDPIERLRRMVRAEFNLINAYADGILLLHREAYILQPTFLRELLRKEHAHIREYEIIIQECIDKGLIRECNVRLSANLIKSMTDAVVLRRWEIRGSASSMEAEKAILDMVFHGLYISKDTTFKFRPKLLELQGKTVFVGNANTEMAAAIVTLFLSEGAKVSVLTSEADHHFFKKVRTHKNIRIYSEKDWSFQSESLLKEVETEFGPLDIYIQDLSLQNFRNTDESESSCLIGNFFEASISFAQRNMAYLENGMAKKESGKIIFLAPWAWDSYTDYIRYEIAKSGIIALTRYYAKKMAKSRVNVNCIIPGFIHTGIPITSSKSTSEVASKVPAGYVGDIKDILNTVLFLSGDSSNYVTGQILEVDGGLSQEM